MAISSYQTVARYDDYSYRSRTRGMGDIREKLRETLSSTRMDIRQTKHCTNRRVIHCDQTEGQADAFSNSCSWGQCDWVQDEFDLESSSGWGEPCETFSWDDQAFNGSPRPPASRSDTSSPTCSTVSSDYSSLNSGTFRLPTPSDSTFSSTKKKMTQSRLRPVSRRQLLQSRKQIQAAHYSPEIVQSHFEQYKSNMLQYGNDPRKLNDYISSGVEIISSAIACHSIAVSDGALQMLIELVQEESVEIQTIYFILQQGVLLSFKKRLSHQQESNQLGAVLSFFIAVIRREPRTVPFITELMYTSQCFPLLEDAINYGNRDEANQSLELFVHLLRAVQILLSTATLQPILPEQSNPKDTAPYHPVAALKRIIRPKILEMYVDRYLKQAEYIDEYPLRLSIHSLIMALYLTAVQLQLEQKDERLADVVMETLASTDLDNYLQTLLKCDTLANKLSKDMIDELKEFSYKYSQLQMWLLSRPRAEKSTSALA